ncbi:MAG: DUF2158 domain-containing protein [Phenylobacterium sp.]|uniref:DUF2158 domain-containing protein n=1 Tax=Phenylobacterium sp. TaxID=1871053 RepID=UPI0027359E3D|nr:DUF2158 domain-containing protein [Phenylobacterium sp.]MDP3175948.1 DUF2158 domain-containing protein [Phenylobacterium sp.]
MTQTFKCGDRVRLKGGEAVMAVTGVSPDSSGDTKVWCAWFDDTHLHQTAGHPAEALEAVEIAELGPPP